MIPLPKILKLSADKIQQCCIQNNVTPWKTFCLLCYLTYSSGEIFGQETVKMLLGMKKKKRKKKSWKDIH